MRKFYSLLKRIHYTVWMGLLTLLLVTGGFPALAQTDFQFLVFDVNGEKKPNNIITAAANYLGYQSRSQELSNASSFLDSGRDLYNAGRFAEAISDWQKATREYEQKGDRLSLALTLSYLSNAYQELGEWDEAKNAIDQSLDILRDRPNPAILARAFNVQGSLELAMGQAEVALDTWKKAEKIYGDIGDETGKLGSIINQSQAMQALGLYRQANKTLERLNIKLQTLPNSQLKAMGLQSLGIALQVVGNLSKSQQILEQSLSISQQLNSAADISTTQFSLANTLRALYKYEEAKKLYQQAAQNTNNSLEKVKCWLNQLSLPIEAKQEADISNLIGQIKSELPKLSPSREAIYAQVNFAQSLMKLKERKKENIEIPLASDREIGKLLAKSLQAAKDIQDRRSEAYALNQLGKLYTETQQWKEAEQLTKQGLIIAQGISASDMMARSQAQLGEILDRQGDLKGAIAAYTEAVSLLQSLRSDLVAIGSEAQFSFRESVEPIYRQLVGLLLRSNPSQENIKQARQVVEALQLAELDNFFREACLNAKPQQIDQIDPQAAVVYPIILPDRLAVILSQPGKPLLYYQTDLPQSDVENTLEQLLESLNPFFSSQDRLRFSQQVYNWLIRPAETQLAANNIKTLVFVLDGLLRNLPMSALYDGKQYLIEKYNVVMTPGLQLLEARSLSKSKLKILTGGITEARQGFSALPGVKTEVEQIASEIPAKIFLDRAFTETNLQAEIQATPFPIVHLATHGQFSSNPEQTFILSWDEKIQVKKFEDLLRAREQGRTNPIELLVLSACQTAAGDKRAALGLAGVAVRSGARSTLATLWSVKDQSTAELMTEFYQQLAKGSGKAEALRAAQLDLLKQPKYAHPFYWAPFILVGNWQ